MNKNNVLGTYVAHQYGFTRADRTYSTSSFLLHTPYKALLQSINLPSRILHHNTQTPPSILKRMRHRTTFVSLATETTPLRGDQQPQIEGDDLDDENDIDIIQLGDKNQPITAMPIYFNEERDSISTPRRIEKIHYIRVTLFLCSSTFSIFYFI